MSKLGELLAWNINRIFPPLAIHQELEKAKRDIEVNHEWAADEARRIIFAFEPYWDLTGKDVLDIGTGLGGKTPVYLETGLRTLTGIDINLKSICSAQEYIHSQNLSPDKEGVVRLLACDAARMPFPDNTFDAIVSINVFEHIARLEWAIQESARVLKPGGLAFLHLPPYYSPWGPHLENWIHFPWPHLFFSEKTLMKVAEREDARLNLNNQFVGSARIDWGASGGRIPDVNRVTLRRFRSLVQDAGFTILQLKLLPVGYSYAQTQKNWLNALAKGVITLATRAPALQEILVTKMVYVLQKSSRRDYGRLDQRKMDIFQQE